MEIRVPNTRIVNTTIDDDVIINARHVLLVGCTITGKLVIPQWLIDDPQSDVTVINCSFNGFQYGDTFYGGGDPIPPAFLEAGFDFGK